MLVKVDQIQTVLIDLVRFVHLLMIGLVFALHICHIELIQQVTLTYLHHIDLFLNVLLEVRLLCVVRLQDHKRFLD